MSLKIGNVLKAIDEGKWVKVPAKAGAFHLKLKQLLPAEQYKYRKKFKAEKDIDNVAELKKMIVAQIVEFKGLLAADGSEITDPELLKNDNFTHAILSLTTEPDGDSVLLWLAGVLGKSDTFAEDDDPDFLASI
jgi:hypothetical protein